MMERVALSAGRCGSECVEYSQLKSYGYNVVYTRTSDSVSWPNNNKKDLQARCDLAKKKMPISLYPYI